MARKHQPNARSDAARMKLPGAAMYVAREHPELWEAFQQLGEKASRAGPLDARSRRLIHLGAGHCRQLGGGDAFACAQGQL